jgi:hypothetical protein
MSYSRLPVLLVLGLGLGLTSGAAALMATCADHPQDRASYRDALSRQVKADEDVLSRYVVNVRSGAITPGDHFPLPGATARGPRIHAATLDANGNVYFVTKDSFVQFDVGFVHRNGDAELLGNQREPRIVDVAHLFGPWWYYHAR